MLWGFLFSAGIEYTQYRCALGMAEADDVICNTLGCVHRRGTAAPRQPLRRRVRLQQLHPAPLLTVTLNAIKASRTGEKSSVLRTVFPKREYLVHRYPYLKKHPGLLPVAWVQRMVRYAEEMRSGADSSASGPIKLARERIELMKRYDIMN